jgi:1,4-dihydroxy-2-naphthoate octaprenyltransferase
MIAGSYYVIAGRVDGNVALAGLPYALGATTVIFGKHIDKVNDDRAKGIHTLPVIVGEPVARAVVVGMFLVQYALVAYLVFVGFFTPVLLVVLFALPKLRDALAIYRTTKPPSRPQAYPAETWPLYYVAYAFAHNRRYGLLFLIGLVTDVVLRALVRLG